MIAVIRVRGTANVTGKLRMTLEMLRLFKVNHLVLVKEENLKMIEKVKDYVTYGPIDEATLSKLLEKRGRLEGNKRITPDFLKSKKIKDFDEMAKMIYSGKIKLKDLGLELVFRMNPPKKGYERAGIKKAFNMGGALGNRGEKINAIILRMA